MDIVAAFMQNETAIVVLAIVAVVLVIVGVILLGTIAAVSIFVGRFPGGVLSLVGVAIILAMYAFATFMTSTMELQYGPAGAVAQGFVYAFGGFLCVLGYARLSWWVLRNRR